VRPDQSYLTRMDTPSHPDAPAIDLVGTDAIMDHFAISRQAVSYWRKSGVPKQHRKSLIMLGESLGLDMSKVTPQTSGARPAAAG
jgi:hypothetical protein